MKILLISLITILILQKSYSQTHEVSGTIYDAQTGKSLEYVTIKVADTTLGTTADKDGKYFIRLKPGGNKLIFSYIGYKTDTSNVYIEDKNIVREIFLTVSEIMTDAIEVYGEDPAYEIIRKAIRYKREFKKNLNEYEYDAYSKFVIRSNRSEIPKTEIPKDSSGKTMLGIYGILESETKGYFKKPDLQKQIVEAKKETANIVRGFAIPLIVNFYDEKLDFNEFKIPTPLSDNPFDDYEYKLIGTTSMDSTLIYKIQVINSTNTRPLLKGTIYIADSLFSLMRVDLSTNDAARPVGIDKIIFQQKFSSYSDRKNKKNIFWMPTDVHIFAEGSFMGLIKFEADVFTIVSDYQLNKKAPKGIFDEFVIKVMPDAKKDSSYWAKNQLIKNTTEEKKAYKKIEFEDKKKDKELKIGLTSLNYGKHFSTRPLSYYHFNRVSGNTLMFNLGYRGRLNRVNTDFNFGYGFSDKKTKYQINYTQRFLNDKRLTFNASIFRKVQPLSLSDYFGISVFYNTIKALFFKEDNLDFYYSSGYNVEMNYRIVPQLRVGLLYNQEKQITATKNTNYSILKKDQQYITNPPINDGFQRLLGVSFRIDPNSFRAIDWGDGDISRFKISSYPQLTLDFTYSGKNFSSTYEYRKYSAILLGKNYINSILNFRYRFGIEYASGQVPFQSLLYFRSNTGTIDAPLGFTALKYQEFLGDRIFFFNFENNFGKLLWGNIPILKNFNLIGLFNMGRNEISDANYDLAANKNFTISNGIYMEAGFGIGRILDIFRIDFAWRLNNFDNIGSKIFGNLIIESF
ncbi:MAG: DUF5686 and carboxypeptidase regulatory-like domain-containing protein [Bacteroidota bacterium]|nr:DUF5686 and carboxypeptidase regulatory-like domain-containing protein [Bacteroidota bacterium]